jgi:hypothetical protein
MPQYNIGDRVAAIEFMIHHLFWRLHAGREVTDQFWQQLRGEFASALRASNPQLGATSEALEAWDHLAQSTIEGRA